MTGAGLVAQLTVSRGDFTLTADLAAAPGETVALVGRNGAGKSTLLSALAGLESFDAGSIRLRGVLLDDAETGVFVPPERRDIGLVLQDPALFPHLTVLDNVAFGLRTGGAGRAAARSTARAALADAGLENLVARHPSAISGGQAARVALVRALVRRPALLLLDEPFAAIDAEQRPRMRADLRAQLAAFDGAAIIVSHDVADAEALADRVIVLDAGRILQQGSLEAVRADPASDTVRRLLAPTSGDQTESA